MKCSIEAIDSQWMGKLVATLKSGRIFKSSWHIVRMLCENGHQFESLSHVVEQHANATFQLSSIGGVVNAFVQLGETHFGAEAREKVLLRDRSKDTSLVDNRIADVAKVDVCGQIGTAWLHQWIPQLMVTIGSKGVALWGGASTSRVKAVITNKQTAVVIVDAVHNGLDAGGHWRAHFQVVAFNWSISWDKHFPGWS